MKFRRSVSFGVILAAIALSVPASTTSCSPKTVAAINDGLTTISGLVSDASTVLSTIDTIVKQFFTVHPQSLDVMTKYAKYMDAAQKALKVSGDVALATGAATKGDATNAFHDFVVAYGDLVTFLQSINAITNPVTGQRVNAEMSKGFADPLVVSGKYELRPQ